MEVELHIDPWTTKRVETVHSQLLPLKPLKFNCNVIFEILYYSVRNSFFLKKNNLLFWTKFASWTMHFMCYIFIKLVDIFYVVYMDVRLFIRYIVVIMFLLCLQCLRLYFFSFNVVDHSLILSFQCISLRKLKVSTQ